MKPKSTVVVTTIAAPNTALNSIAQGCQQNNFNFIVIGDSASPPEFNLDHCQYFGIEEQLNCDFAFARECPKNHYSRKNIGYLFAICQGSEIIIDTDDDNFPLESFWNERETIHTGKTLIKDGWVNIYSYFTQNDENIWPRGLPLDQIHGERLPYASIPEQNRNCPIQQGLANNNPDVDAVYRLALPLPIYFRNDRRIALGKNTWSPFNSQNTTWWKDTFPLLYLPSYCSFRMTDIWRSFVAQRIAWENDWYVLYHEPTVSQDRNEHDLMKDFSDEIQGYLHNKNICEELAKLTLKGGKDSLYENLLLCYEKLVTVNMIDKKELSLVQTWSDDLEKMT